MDKQCRSSNKMYVEQTSHALFDYAWNIIVIIIIIRFIFFNADVQESVL